MPSLSLTDFVDVVSASGIQKANKVKQIKNRPDYNPAFDFYKRIRELIIDTHKNGYQKTRLDSCMDGITDKKKLTAYPFIIAGYKKWWGRKDLEWFDAPSELFSSNGVEVRTNPELGLHISGKPHLIKLYFKSDVITKNRVDIITHLMSMVLSVNVPSDTIMSVLDVRKSKLIPLSAHVEGISSVIMAEMAYISSLWPSI